MLENEYIRAAITPQWGGKIWSAYDKKSKRNIFFNNPAHQPDNIGYRKAWTSGGCEWNWGPGYVAVVVVAVFCVFMLDSLIKMMGKAGAVNACVDVSWVTCSSRPGAEMPVTHFVLCTFLIATDPCVQNPRPNG